MANIKENFRFRYRIRSMWMGLNKGVTMCRTHSFLTAREGNVLISVSHSFHKSLPLKRGSASMGSASRMVGPTPPPPPTPFLLTRDVGCLVAAVAVVGTPSTRMHSFH